MEIFTGRFYNRIFLAHPVSLTRRTRRGSRKLAMPSAEKLDTHRKALSLNLDPSAFGSFAEIGAGQEVARWFLIVGGASGSVAKTISHMSPGWLVLALGLELASSASFVVIFRLFFPRVPSGPARELA